MLPDAGSVSVRRDGEAFGAWRAPSATAIEIDTVIGDHRYEIQTGYRRGNAARTPGTDEARSSSSNVAARRMATSPIEILSATRAVAAGAASCPCCAGSA